jgi:tRNA G18 (ribose-2'-O)-methylase SpoU
MNTAPNMRGYFGIGVEEISKEGNVGNLARSAHAFGASFFFTISPFIDVKGIRSSDTSGSFDHVPYHQYESAEDLTLPNGCQLVGVELIDNSIELPSFRHPTRAAYVLGPEMGSISPTLQEKCDHIIQIPTKFCINVGVAGALVMYDRLISMGKFPPRPVKAGGPENPYLPHHNFGPRRKIRTSAE